MRYHKHTSFATEQQTIKEQLLSILELDEFNSFTLHTLDNNSDKQKQIMELIPDIRKYFSFSQYDAITHPEKVQRPYLSIIKNLLRQDYYIVSTDYRLKEERTKRYFVLPRKTNYC